MHGRASIFILLKTLTWSWLPRPLICRTEEAEAGIMFRIFLEMLSRLCLKIRARRDLEYGSVVEYIQ